MCTFLVNPMTNTDSNKIKEILRRGVESVYPSPEALEKKLRLGQRLRLYCGYDPTNPTLHLGHTVTLRKLAQFQELGHQVIMLIGDFTGMIGDPTDKSAARKRLTREEARKNAKNYQKLAGTILKFKGPNPAKVMYNSQWNDELSFVNLIEFSSYFTVQQMLDRDMFQDRIKKDKPIYLHEFLYPLAQAYDSLAMDVDLEIGGSDQIFNMLRGRDLIKALKKKEKFVLAVKLLVDPLGKKMGKTEGNMVTLDAPAQEMYGKIMSWPDSLISLGLELCTDLPIEEIKQINNQIQEGKLNPRDAKARLAREIVSIHHDEKAALRAEKEFNRIFKEHQPPNKISDFRFQISSINILDLLVQTKLASSKAQARRLISQKGISIDGKTVERIDKIFEIPQNGMIIKKGKRHFARVIRG